VSGRDAPTSLPRGGAGRGARLFLRALLLRCPNCGRARLFASWFRLRPACPACGLRTDRGEDGYVVGAYMFNIMASELCWGALFVLALALTWPRPPWDLLLYASGFLMLGMPVLFYPFSRSVFLAFDLVFRPAPDTEAPATTQDQRTR
jgi:uncharacterized protein (DUF983 family)